jgi:hypothetical protein
MGRTVASATVSEAMFPAKGFLESLQTSGR